MPMRARNFGRFVALSPTETPSTVIVPAWNGSSPLVHLISVLLPEPDGPQTTTTSPRATLAEHSFRIWVAPYHFADLVQSDHAAVLLAMRPTPSDAAQQMTKKT